MIPTPRNLATVLFHPTAVLGAKLLAHCANRLSEREETKIQHCQQPMTALPFCVSGIFPIKIQIFAFPLYASGYVTNSTKTSNPDKMLPSEWYHSATFKMVIGFLYKNSKFMLTAVAALR